MEMTLRWYGSGYDTVTQNGKIMYLLKQRSRNHGDVLKEIVSCAADLAQASISIITGAVFAPLYITNPSIS